MKGSPEERAALLAQYMIESGDTVRGAAKKFCNHALYTQVQQVLLHNKKERHIRGGIATREKFKAQRERMAAQIGR